MPFYSMCTIILEYLTNQTILSSFIKYCIWKQIFYTSMIWGNLRKIIFFHTFYTYTYIFHQSTTVIKSDHLMARLSCGHSVVTHTIVIIFPESVISNIFPQSCWHLLKHVWVFLVLNWWLSKHQAPGLLIFIIRTSCRALFSWMGRLFVTSWKNEMLFIYKNRGATVGDIICVWPALAMAFDSDDDIINCMESK